MLLVLVLSTIGFYLWLKYEDGMAGIRRDVEHAASLERSAWDAADEVTFSAILDPEADPGWKGHMRRMFDHGRRWGIQSALSQGARVDELDVHGNTAVAQIEIPALIPGGSAYRETRFYRYSGDQWLRTSPDPDLWGRVEEETSTDHFRFVYHPRDRLPVQETAADIEAFYTRITADLGAGDVIDDPLLIEVRPRTDLLTYRFTGGRLAVP
jgi:hypothetical protein